MSGPLSLSQINSIKALANAATGELFGKAANGERKRYQITINCSCGKERRASWVSDGFLLLSKHLGHSTRVKITPYANPADAPARSAARIDLHKDLIYAALEERGPLTTRELAEAAEISERTAARRLGEMERDGEVDHEHGGRGRANAAIWRLA